jgi:hypothetical protein
VSPPTVTALVAAYNYEHFIERTLRSALDQDYPAELLDVIVVDDGSADGTAAVAERMAAEYPGRVQVIRQANAGYVAATNVAAAAARGELLAILDADDVWPQGKIRAQVELLQQRPEVSLVYTDMTMIDADDNVVEASVNAWCGRQAVDGPGLLGHLLTDGNAAPASSIVVRAAHRDVCFPVPAEIPYVDWWLACRGAMAGELGYLEGPRTGYRTHGGNLTLQVSGDALARERRKEIAFRRWFLSHVDADALAPAEWLGVVEAMDRVARSIVAAARIPFVDLGPVGDAEAAAAALAAGEAALAAGDVSAAAASFARAAGLDPWSAAARHRLLDAATNPLAGARRFVTVALADELLAHDALLRAYGEAFTDADDATLVIWTPGIDPAVAGERLMSLVTEAGLDGPGSPDLLAVTEPAASTAADAVRDAARAVLSFDPALGASFAAPIVTADAAALRALAAA